MDNYSEKVCRVFGALLRELRKGREFTQEKLAFESGIDRTYISLLERGRYTPTLTKMLVLSKALQIPFERLISLFIARLDETQNL